MATDKTGTWSDGESILWYSPTSGLDATWSLGESYILDEVFYGGLVIPVFTMHYKRLRR